MRGHGKYAILMPSGDYDAERYDTREEADHARRVRFGIRATAYKVVFIVTSTWGSK